MHQSFPSPVTRVVQVVITQMHDAIMFPALALVKPALEYTRRRFMDGGATGYQDVIETVPLWHDLGDRLAFPAGLRPRVCSILRQHGYRVEVRDLRDDGPRLHLELGHIMALCHGKSDRQRELIQAVAGRRQGQIEVSGPQDVVATCLLIGEICPEANIAVCVGRRKQAWHLRNELSERLGDEVGLAISPIFRLRRWLVGTYGSVGFMEDGRWDIVIFPDGEEATSQVVDRMMPSYVPRIYALVQPQRTPDRIGRLLLEALAGPVIHRLTRPRVPVSVVMLAAPAAAIAATNGDALARKRAIYWHSESRNAYIARVAQAVAAAERAPLKELGLRNRDIRIIQQMGSPRVVILVESREHGRRLHALLQGWTLRDCVAREETTEEGGATAATGPAIITMVYAASRGVRADVVIRATGTEWASPVKGFPPRRDQSKQRAVMLIDIDDGANPQAAQDSRRRREEYLRRGLQVAMLPGSAREVS